MNSHQINGRTGEYLSLFDISNNGYNCFLVNENLVFDVGMTTSGNLYRVQVKTASVKKTNTSYTFHIGRRTRKYLGNNRIKNVPSYYDINDFEILALAIIPLRKVLYIPFHEIYGQKHINLTGKESYPLDNCLQSVIDAEGK